MSRIALLTPKQKRFCLEYIVDLNATQAAIRAGYSRKTARSMGQENLTKPDIKKEVSRLKAERSSRTRIEGDAVLGELAKGAFQEIAPEQIKFSEKVKCLELLGKHLGLFEQGDQKGPKDLDAVRKRLKDALERAFPD